MSLFALITVLLLEQQHALARQKFLSVWLDYYVRIFPAQLNAGKHKHGKIAWLLALSIPLCGATLLYVLLSHLHPIFAWAWCVLVLYLCMGFRLSRQSFSDILHALHEQDLPRARALLATWRKANYNTLNEEEIARLSIEQALLSAHRSVFGVTLWFVIFMLLGAGPIGAILYRLTHLLATRWSAESGDFAGFATKMQRAVEWLPARCTAATFAIVGDFEGTVYCWRNQAATWADAAEGMVLSSGAGALGVRLGSAIQQNGVNIERPELGIGDEADTDFMQSTTGIVWRGLVFWMLVLVLAGMASLVG